MHNLIQYMPNIIQSVTSCLNAMALKGVINCEYNNSPAITYSMAQTYNNDTVKTL